MITWPVAVVICFSILAVYALIDTWLKRPYFEKRAGSLVIRMRGEEARVAMEHFNSLTVMGFEDAMDDEGPAASDRTRRHARLKQHQADVAAAESTDKQ